MTNTIIKATVAIDSFDSATSAHAFADAFRAVAAEEFPDAQISVAVAQSGGSTYVEHDGVDNDNDADWLDHMAAKRADLA